MEKRRRARRKATDASRWCARAVSHGNTQRSFKKPVLFERLEAAPGIAGRRPLNEKPARRAGLIGRTAGERDDQRRSREIRFAWVARWRSRRETPQMAAPST